MGSHSRFAPSATEREYQCPPSFLLNEQLPDRNSLDAAHGTSAHHLGELCLKTDQDTGLYAGCVIAVTDKGDCRFVHEKAPVLDGEQAFDVDDEMVAAVQSYVDWCRELPGEHFVEVRVEHTRWCPDLDENGEKLGPQYGTSDHNAIDDDTLTVTDLKYGKGVKVYAYRNKQAIKYALGAWDKFKWLYPDVTKVKIRICQPRLDHFDSWEVSLIDLIAFGMDIKDRLELVFDPDAEFNPGEKQCKFCKAAARCRPLHDFVFDQRALAFDDETMFKSPRLLSIEEMADAYLKRPLFDMHYEAIAREMRASMISGVEAPGLKLVNGVTHRRWKNEEVVKRELLRLGLSSHAIETKKLVSPNQAEALLSKEKRVALQDLWEKPQGGAVVALEDDPRGDYDAQRSVNEMFDDERPIDGLDD